MLYLIPLFFLLGMKSDKEAYRLFNAKGKEVKYSKLLKDALESDIIFFGELHNNPICHWLQYELTRDLHSEKEGKLILGAEMFETDNQLLLDEYTSDKIKTRNFEDEARLWNNYATDYKPLIEYARENKIPFVATNIPRRYAAIVHKMGFEGLDSLSEMAKGLIAPLPVLYDPGLEGYKEMLTMMGGMGHGNENLPKAQAIKDATMSHFILENWEEGFTFLHFNGTYHSDNYEGIVWYIQQSNPDLKVLTISSVEQDTIKDLKEEHLNLADYILSVPSSMTKTY